MGEVRVGYLFESLEDHPLAGVGEVGVDGRSGLSDC
jgi:hypothetical protein